jgi:hypothetical protein
VLEAEPKRTGEHRECLGLGKQPNLGVIERRSKVTPVVDDRGEGSPLESNHHLLRCGVKSVPDDLGRQWVDRFVGATLREMGPVNDVVDFVCDAHSSSVFVSTRQPDGSTSITKPSST